MLIIVRIILLLDLIYLGNLIYKLLNKNNIKRKLYNGDDTRSMKRNAFLKYVALVSFFIMSGIIANMI